MNERTVQDDTGGRSSTRPAFRADIDGLRALAIFLVVAFHVGLPGFRGGFIGVDVFFVISGYLITRKLLHESAATGRPRLLGFWANRLRRLVPALLLMVSTTLVLSVLILSPLEWSKVARQAVAAALFVSNVEFARNATDYFAGGVLQSPYLPTWSLGLEEQFYLLWPVVIAGGYLLVRRRPAWSRPVLIIGFGLILVTSLAVDLVLTRTGSTWAFYGLQSRAWEFAVGGLLAIVVSTAGRRLRVRGTPAAFAGLASIAVGTWIISSTTAYPGLWALLPVAGAALVIWGGTPGDHSTPRPTRWLALSGPQWLGRVSYSWYLWHWPLMILAVAALNCDTMAVRLAAATAALGVAALTHRFFEQPMRLAPVLVRSRAVTFATGAAMTGLVIVAALGVSRYANTVLTRAPYQQLAAVKASQNLYECKRSLRSPAGAAYCEDGDLNGATSVLLVGDSHARQWKQAFADAAERAGIRLVVRWRSACPAVPVHILDAVKVPDQECLRFQEETATLVDELHPNLVVTTQRSDYDGSILHHDDSPAPLGEQVTLWRDASRELFTNLQAKGIRTGSITDNPRLPFDPVLCLGRFGATEEKCTPTRADALATTNLLRQADAEARVGLDVPTFDVTDRICSEDVCRIKQGDVYVFVDSNHLARAWTTTQQTEVTRFLHDALGGPGDP